jgi:Uncharacterized conserved protein
MTTQAKPMTLEITRTIAAPVERVYKAWTQPEHMKQWFGCGKTVEVVIQQDFRVGGEFRVEMHCNDGEIAIVNGTFKNRAEQSTGLYLVE